MRPVPFLRVFSKIVCLGTFFLIFVGGLVKSTESGLAVPDWPLSYGTLFPPMVGGVFYEHGHRMVAAVIGFLMLCLTISLGYIEKRRWVKRLGFAALGMVILQGILGGITVLFFLPTPVSIAHGLLAQTFFILTVILAYTQSLERYHRTPHKEIESPRILCINFIFVMLIYLQLFLGALMRHTGSGLAIPDFPKMGDQWIPLFNDAMFDWINNRRFMMEMEPVTAGQVIVHFCHRFGAFIIFIFSVVLSYFNLKYSQQSLIHRTVFSLNGILVIQIVLGAMTILSKKESFLTSAHVAIGAALLGLSVLLLLRCAPLSWHEFKQNLLKT